MHHVRIMAAVALAGLAGCSLAAKVGLGDGKAPSSPSTTLGSSSPSAPVAAPKVASEESDSGPIQQIIGWLDELEASLQAKQWGAYIGQSRKLNADLLMRRSHADEPKIGKIKQRLAALDAAAFQTFGGRLHKAVGKGARVLELDAEGKEASEAVIKACAATQINPYGDEQKLKELAAAPAKYEEAIARAKKINPDSLLWLGSAVRDMPLDLMQCELDMQAAEQRRIEEYQPEVLTEETRLKTKKMCGKIEWLADGIQLGANKFAPYTKTLGGQQFAEEVPCNKLAKKDKYPPALAAAVKEFRASNKNVVTVLVGKPYFETDDDDFRVHRYQLLASYSKDFIKSANPCGDGDKIFCEIGGSKGAAAYNRAEHALDRSAANAGKDPERCRNHLKQAKAQWEGFVELKTSLEKRKEWISGATYRTKKGVKLKEKDFVAVFEKKGKLADDRLLNGFCKAGAK